MLMPGVQQACCALRLHQSITLGACWHCRCDWQATCRRRHIPEAAHRRGLSDPWRKCVDLRIQGRQHDCKPQPRWPYFIHGVPLLCVACIDCSVNSLLPSSHVMRYIAFLKAFAVSESSSGEADLAGRHVSSGVNSCYCMQHNGELLTFESPSAFSIFFKRLVNPARKADDGWKTVRFRGKFLDHYKMEFARQRAGKCPMLPTDSCVPPCWWLRLLLHLHECMYSDSMQISAEHVLQSIAWHQLQSNAAVTVSAATVLIPVHACATDSGPDGEGGAIEAAPIKRQRTSETNLRRSSSNLSGQSNGHVKPPQVQHSSASPAACKHSCAEPRCYSAWTELCLLIRLYSTLSRHVPVCRWLVSVKALHALVIQPVHMYVYISRMRCAGTTESGPQQV